MEKLVWGCCWFNEETETVINFLKHTILSFKKKQIELIPIIFVASTKIENIEINKVKDNINNIVVFKNKLDIYPNKNYGVYAIVNYAYKIKADYLAIVDPDWVIKKYESFIESMLKLVVNKEADLVIPNIKSAAGRSNILVGKSVIELFYPDYKNIILTPFAGSFIANTKSIYPIIESKNYHFDWGGEWDIISYAISNKLKVKSVEVDVLNIRHRNNNSKMQDSYQIWRSVFSNSDLKNRFKYMLDVKEADISKNKLYKCISDKKLNIDEMITNLNNYPLDSTSKQLLYMVLYPISCLIHNEIINYPVVEEKNNVYEKGKINEIGILAIYCIKKSIINSKIDKKTLIKNALTITGNYFGTWDKNKQEMGRKLVNSQIEELL